MKFKVIFHKKAEIEFANFDNSIRILIAKQIKKLESTPHIGKPLGNKMNLNLTGLYKLYINNKKIRIVYQIVEEEILVFILGVGNRDKEEIYKLIENRLKDIKN